MICCFPSTQIQSSGSPIANGFLGGFCILKGIDRNQGAVLPYEGGVTWEPSPRRGPFLRITTTQLYNLRQII